MATDLRDADTGIGPPVDAKGRGGHLRVNLYLKHFPPSGGPLVGGTSKAVAGFASGLAKYGTAVTVLCEGPRESTCELEYVVRSFSEVHTRNPFALSPGLVAFLRATAQHSVTVLNGMFHPSVYSLARLLSQMGGAYIVAPHGAYDPLLFRQKPHLKWPYWFCFERPALNGSMAIQVLDRRHSSWLRRLGISTAVIEVPNGLSDDALWESPAPSAKQGDPISICFLGRIDAYNKGLDLLVEAFRAVADTKRVRLVLRGPDWGGRAALAKQAASLIREGKVAFLEPDYMSPTSLLFQSCDIVCLPSRHEGFGLSALEAMAAERVVLVSETAGVAPHVLASGCGVVVTPTVSDIVRGLHALIGRRNEWKSMGEKGREYVRTRLRWEPIAAQALDCYRSLLGSRLSG